MDEPLSSDRLSPWSDIRQSSREDVKQSKLRNCLHMVFFCIKLSKQTLKKNLTWFAGSHSLGVKR